MQFKRKNLTSPRLRKMRRKAVVRKTLLFGALVVSVFLAGRTFLNFSFFAINSINIVGAEKTSVEEIKSIVVSELSGRWLGIIPKNNFLFMGKEAIANAILLSNPSIANVRSVLAGLGNLVIEIKEKTPYAKWCNVFAIQNNCLAVDSRGFAFEKVDQMASTTTTIFTIASPKLTANVFDKTKFEKLRQFIESFKLAGFTVYSVKEQDTDYFIKLDDGSEIKVKGEDNPDNITRKLSSIKMDLEKEGRGGSVEYIDLRYGNKVYLKMR